MYKLIQRIALICAGFVALLLINTPAIASVTFQQTPEPPLDLNSPAANTNVYLPLVAKAQAAVPSPTGTIIDHNSIALFERIPERYLTAARSLRVLFADRSVGQNINESLDCLTYTTWPTSAASCRRDYINNQWDFKTFTQTDYTAGVVPARILFAPNYIRYNRSNWKYEYLDGSWGEITRGFVTDLGPRYLGSKDVLSFQFSYLNVNEFNDIASPTNGFFIRKPNEAGRYDIGDLEAFWASNPTKRTFLWTTSLSRETGTQVATDFNNQMRQYGGQHNLFVLDVAAIESHNQAGQPCYDNRDGVPYCATSGECENYPNDNRNLPAICQDYTTEKDGGHLGSVSAGRVRIAKAFWVLMARMAGWDGRSQ